MNFTTRIKAWSSDESLQWLHKSYILDWLVVLSFWLGSLMISRLPTYERDFSPDDVTINHPHKKQQISSGMNHMLSLYIPLAIAAVVGAYKKSPIHIHHAFLAASAGSALSKLVTDFLKNRVGRLRPDFISRCQWDPTLQFCTGSPSSISDGRHSFPSGHSSTAFAGMVFLSLYLTSQLSIFIKSASALSALSSKLARLAVILTPLFYASWVAISRVQDNKHHVEDIIVGSLIGSLSSTTCFLIYWHNPFSPSAHNPRSVYTDDPHSRPSANDYHIATFDDV